MPTLHEQVRKKLEAARQYRKDKAYNTEWKRYYNYYIGNHWKTTIKSPHPKIVMNICLNMVESVISALLTQSPTAYVVPVTESNDDAQACESLTAAFASWAEEYDFQRSLRLGLRNRFIYGTNHYKVWWDKSAREGQGEFAIEPVGPFAIFHDPYATCLKDCEYIVQGKWVSVEAIKRLAEAKLPETQDIEHELRATDYQHKEGGAIVYEGWFDGGDRMVVFTDDKVLAEADNPYQHKQFPFVRDVDIEIPDEYEGMGMIQPIMTLQGEINERRSQGVIYSRFFTYPLTVVDSGAVKNADRLTTEPGTIIQKQPGMEFRREQPLPMPAHVQAMPEMAMTDAERVLGVRDIPQGRRPYSITSGKGIEAVAQFQSQRLEGAKARPMEQAIKESARLAVELMMQFYMGERTVRYWQGAELMTQALPERFPRIPFSIRVEPGTTLAVNKVARVQMALQLAMMGKIDDEELFRALEWPRWREMMKRQSWQNQQMLQRMGQMAQIQRGAGAGPQRNLSAEGVTGGIGNVNANLQALPTSQLVGMLGKQSRMGAG